MIVDKVRTSTRNILLVKIKNVLINDRANLKAQLTDGQADPGKEHGGGKAEGGWIDELRL